MATTRTPGITVDTEGFRTINKERRGERILRGIWECYRVMSAISRFAKYMTKRCGRS